MTEEALLDLIGRAFSSVWPLELLTVLSQEPGTGWRTDDLARTLRANVHVVSQGLNALTALGLVAVQDDERYQLHPRSPDLAGLARELTDLYSRKPRSVIRAIFAQPQDRIQTFADAFRLRKDTC